MTRSRAQVAGGYSRKTVSLPSTLVADIEKHLADQPGLTMSAFVTMASEDYLKKQRRKRR